MKIQTLPLILGLFSLAALNASATPISGSVSATASLNPGSTKTTSASLTGTSQEANAIAYTSTGFADILSNGDAGWESGGNSGSVSFEHAVFRDAATSAAESLLLWNYTFTADADGVFELNGFTEFSLISIFGGSNDIWLEGDLGYLSITPGLGVYYLAAVTAGTTYSISLHDNVSLSGEGFDAYGNIISNYFDWHLYYADPGPGTSVPDTAHTLGLIALSFAGLAVVRRKLPRT